MNKINVNRILILKYKKYLKNKDVSNFVKYFGTDERLIAEFLSKIKNEMTEDEMILIIDSLNRFRYDIDERIINEIETLDESQRPIFINALIKAKGYNVIYKLSSKVNWIFKNNDSNSNKRIENNYLEKLEDVIIESNVSYSIFDFAKNVKLTQDQKSKLVDAIIKTGDLEYMRYFGENVDVKDEDFIKLSKTILMKSISIEKYDYISYYFDDLEKIKIKLLKDAVIETKDKIVIIYYIFYAKDFKLLKEVFETPENYKEYCEKSKNIRLGLGDINEFYLDSKFSYVDDNIDNYTTENSSVKSLK